MRKLILASLLLASAAPAAATQLQLVRIEPVAAQATRDLRAANHGLHMAGLSPGLRDWVSARARSLVDAGVAPDEAQLAREAEARLQGQDYAQGDISALVFLVMAEASKQADEDLRDLMAQMKAQNERKASMREAMQTEQRAAAAGGIAKGAGSPEAQAICVDPPCRPQIAPVQPQIARVQPRIGLAKPASLQPSATAGRLDGMSEMGEMESMRLQMAMDRLSKFMETLSNLMKKSSDTASTITSNLK